MCGHDASRRGHGGRRAPGPHAGPAAPTSRSHEARHEAVAMEYSGTVPGLTDPGAYGVPLGVALNRIMDQSLWRLGQLRAAAVRRAGGSAQAYLSRSNKPRDLLADNPVPQRIRRADAEFADVRLAVRRWVRQSVNTDRLRLFGRKDTVDGAWHWVP